MLLSEKIERCLSALTLSTPNLEYTGSPRGAAGMTRTARVCAALSFAGDNPAGAAVLKAVYTRDPHDIRSAAFELHSVLCMGASDDFWKLVDALCEIVDPDARKDAYCGIRSTVAQLQVSIGVLIIHELIELSSSRRCGYCKGFKPDCDHCDGTGLVRGRQLSERRIISVLSLPNLTRHSWRTKCAAHYSKLGHVVETLINDTARSLNKAMFDE